MDSILVSVKKALGIDNAYDAFDQELIMYINTVIATLTQLGVGSADGFTVFDENEKWTDFVPSEPKWEQIKTYIYTKVKLIFDPPQSSAAVEAMNKIASELEWRIYTAADAGCINDNKNQN